MYGIKGLDDQQYLQQLLGTSPYDETPQQGFQPQQTQTETGLLGDTSNLEAEMQALANDDVSAQLAQWGQMGAGGGGGQNRIAQQQAANQQALNSNKGGGLLGFAMQFLPWGKWLGNAGKAIGKAVGL